MTDDKYSGIVCRVCNQGGSVRRAQVRRMSTPVVAIGYILLVPSVLGMLIGLVMVFASGSAGGNLADEHQKAYVAKIHQMGLTQTQEEYVLGLSNPSREALQASGLASEQIQNVLSAHLAQAASNVGSGAGAALGIGVGITMLIGSFVGGLLGWLLIMKKAVLLCGNCKGFHAEAA